MGKYKFILIHNHTGSRGAVCIGVTAGIITGYIYLGNEFFHSGGDTIGPAESTDEAALCERICLL